MNETTTYTEQQIDDWGNIFGASAGMWSWWETITHVSGDWDTPGDVILTIEDPHDPLSTVSVLVGPKVIFDALATVTVKYPWLFQRRDGLLDLDASSADVVLQYAVLGDVVFG